MLAHDNKVVNEREMLYKNKDNKRNNFVNQLFSSTIDDLNEKNYQADHDDQYRKNYKFLANRQLPKKTQDIIKRNNLTRCTSTVNVDVENS
ncbi:unnamed protein product [Rotaria magnacalcarata]